MSDSRTGESGTESSVMQPWYRVRTLASLGTAMAEIRKNAGLNQDDAAALAHASRPTMSRLERGAPSSTAVIIDLLASTGYEVLLVPRGSRVTVKEPS